MGSLIEAVLAGSLVGIFTLLGVWLAGWQERKRAREAHEARKKEMVYAKQLEVLEEAVKWLTFMHIEWKAMLEVYGKSWLAYKEGKMGEELGASLLEEGEVVAQKMHGIIEGLESREMIAKISTYLPLESKEAFQEYNAQAIASVEGVGERLSEREGGDVEEIKEQLDVAYEATVLKMREHLDIKESVGAEEATRIGGRRRLKLKFWASGRTTSRSKS